MTVLALSYALQTSLSIRPSNSLAFTEEQILMTGQSGEGLPFSVFALSPPPPLHPPETPDTQTTPN